MVRTVLLSIVVGLYITQQTQKMAVVGPHWHKLSSESGTAAKHF